jgi:hypothetical protein
MKQSIQILIATLVVVAGAFLSFAAVNGDLIGFSVGQEMAIFLLGFMISINAIVLTVKLSYKFLIGK